MPEAFLHTVRLQDCLRRTYLGDATAAGGSLRVASDRREWLSAARGGEQPPTSSIHPSKIALVSGNKGVADAKEFCFV
jgi:hypothetical protein